MRFARVFGLLAAAAMVPLLIGAPPAAAGDWRGSRHHYHQKHYHDRHHGHRDRPAAIVVAPGIVLQLGPSRHAPRHFFQPAPRHRHDRLPRWHRRHGGDHHFDHRRDHRRDRGGHRRYR